MGRGAYTRGVDDGARSPWWHDRLLVALAAAFALAVAAVAGPRMLATIACGATLGWWAVAMVVRGGYFERFRERLKQGQAMRANSLPRLDLKSLEALLEAGDEDRHDARAR